MPLWTQFQVKPPPGTPINWSCPLSQGLVAAFPFNEGSGSNVYDATNQSPTGAFASGSSAPTWISGKYGTTINFVGSSSQQILVPFFSGLNFPATGGSFSWATWLYLASVPSGWTAIWTHGRDQSSWMGLWNSGSNLWDWVIGGIDSAGVAPSTGWHQIVGTYYSGNRYLFVDGKLVATTSDTEASATTSGLYIGGDNGYDTYFTGVIDHIFLSSRQWQLADVQAHYANPWQIFSQPQFDWLLHYTASGTAYTLGGTTGSYGEAGQGATLQSGRHLIATLGGYTATGASSFPVHGRYLAGLTGSYAESGLGALPVHGRYLTGSAGAYAESGLGALPVHGRYLTGATGSYLETGAGASLVHGRYLVCTAGVYSETGEGATLTWVHTGGGTPYTLSAALAAYAETGEGATLQSGRHLIGGVGVYSETGAGATPIHGRHLGATTGSYTETGQSAGLIHGRYLVGAAAVYSETGAGATLTWVHTGGGTPYSLSAAIASYAETGIGATLKSGRHLIGATGSYLETGAGAGLIHGRYLVGAMGVYAETGAGATLKSGRHLIATTGSYAESGQGATLKSGRHLIATTAVYTETGNAAFPGHGRILAAATGLYLETGGGATLKSGRHLLAATGSYTETGGGATLVWISLSNQLYLPYEFTSILIATGNTNPFGIDPEQTTSIL